MEKIEWKSTIADRSDGINPNCTLPQEDIKKCIGYGAIGERACDSRHVPCYKIVRTCKYSVFGEDMND